MTLIQTHPGPTDTSHPHRTAIAASDAAGPQVWGAMTVEVALSVMAAARTGRLVVCDEDGRRTGLVTLALLTTVRDSSGYTDRVRLRDITGEHGTAPGVLVTPAEPHSR
ncbi:CBS domain-containing protein [Streptomyces sp. LaPpAH-108]|uniref:CBS domain-containing protein n=1 Tax=Streptomyces sp. LaPpAH-108 TaxID=1155714 RepID=UPI00037CA784|nr:CBS domain-containing protein [Streptomyces sp. LaPpAH-108]